jgi:hypothetical protein
MNRSDTFFHFQFMNTFGQLVPVRSIDAVMKSQQHLVEVVGKFTPKIVKMDGAKHKTWGRKKDEAIGE